MKLSIFICPSDPPDAIKPGWDGPSSYIANGFIFQDGKGLPLSYVANHDGEAETLMLSENVRTDSTSVRVNWHNWWDCGFNFKTGTSIVGSACSVRGKQLRSAAIGRQFWMRNPCYRSGGPGKQNQRCLSDFDDDTYDESRHAARQHFLEPC